MSRLTFVKQILMGVVGLGVGHLLSWITNIRFFENLGWIFYGFLFVIHPVWPERINTSPGIRKWIRFIGVLIILTGLSIRSGSGEDFFQSRIFESLEMDVRRGSVVESFDDHSSFHGDGTMYAVLSFPDDSLKETISAPGGWNVLPLPENLTTLVYGTRTDSDTYGPYIGVTVPRIQKGYYFFLDRKNETHSDDMVLKGNSFNYTIAIYDSENDLLYYCEYDT